MGKIGNMEDVICAAANANAAGLGTMELLVELEVAELESVVLFAFEVLKMESSIFSTNEKSVYPF